MKIRVRFRSNRKVVEIPDDPAPTFALFRDRTAATLGIQSRGLQLSLNGTDALSSEDTDLLSNAGIVSGDLIMVLDNPDLNPSPPSQPSNPSIPSTSEQASSMEAVASDPDPVDADLNVYLKEPMLLRECTDDLLPQSLLSAFAKGGVANSHQALTVALHVLMIECGFITKNEATESSLVKTWKKPGRYEMLFSHPQIPHGGFSCICVPMQNQLIIHGLSPDLSKFSIKIQCSTFVTNIIEDAQSAYVKRQLPILSRKFKDSIAHPLLQSCLPEGSLPSLTSLMLEMKLHILKHLDVKSLLNLSETCRYFNEVCRERYLWRRLYLQRFGRYHINDLSINWKELYEEEEKLRPKRGHQPWAPHYPPDVFQPPIPPTGPLYPPGFIGGDYDLLPGFPHFPGPGSGRRPRPSPFNPLFR